MSFACALQISHGSRLAVSVACLLIAGCATKVMQSTPFYDGGEVEYIGDAAGRLNAWPLAYWRNPVGSVAWPVVSFSDNHFALRPLYSQYRQNGRDGAWDEFNFLWPLVQFDAKHHDHRIFPLFWGEDCNGHGYQCLFPLWYKDENAFISLLYGQGGDGDRFWWVLPVSLSWGEGWKRGDDFRNECTVLLGLGSWDCGKASYCEYCDWRAFPFIHHSSYDYLKESNRYNTSETQVACYLAGWKTCGGELSSLYVFPLFGWSNDDSWLTPLGGQLNYAGTTNTVITPIAGITSGKTTGGWVFPVWYHNKSHDFDERFSAIDSPTLPDFVSARGDRFWVHDDKTLFLHDIDHRVYGHRVDTNSYDISETIKRGHRWLFNYKFRRDVTFGMNSRAKNSDKESSESSFLFWLYQYERDNDRISGDEHARHRVLWKLWDWEETNGEITLDAFPGFTYDSRKDGYTKTSLLWRFFRYEHDPKSGTSIDFLVIPIWR